MILWLLNLLVRVLWPSLREKMHLHPATQVLKLGFFFQFVSAVLAKQDCIFNFGQFQYDFNPLARQAFRDTYYEMKAHTDNTFYINMCRPVADAGCAAGSSDISGCQDWSGGAAVLGDAATQTFFVQDSQHVTVSYTNGDAGQGMQIQLICSPSGGTGTPFFFEQQGKTYFFQWPTANACGQSPATSGSSSTCQKGYSCSQCLSVNGADTLCSFCEDSGECMIATWMNQTCDNFLVNSEFCPDPGFSFADMLGMFFGGFGAALLLSAAIVGLFYLYQHQRRNHTPTGPEYTQVVNS